MSITFLSDLNDLNPSPETAEQPMISPAEGGDLAKRIGAVGYRECSALAQFGVEDVFAEAAEAAVRNKDQIDQMRRNKCCLLM